MPKRALKRRISAANESEIEKSSLHTEDIKNEVNYTAFEEFEEEMVPCVESTVEQLHERMLGIETKLEKIITNQAIILNALRKLAKDAVPATPIYFPLKNEQELAKMDREAEMDMEKVSDLIKSITHGELIKRFNSLLDENIIMNYNLDGVNTKKAFKEYRALNKAIYQAHVRNGYIKEDYFVDIRGAFRMHKQRLFKRNYDRRKKQATSEAKAESDSDSPISEIQF